MYIFDVGAHAMEKISDLSRVIEEFNVISLQRTTFFGFRLTEFLADLLQQYEDHDRDINEVREDWDTIGFYVLVSERDEEPNLTHVCHRWGLVAWQGFAG